MITSTHLTTTKGGCGCTGSVAMPAIGTTSCASCGCGGCSACGAPGPFVRPKFFPGQLLTEDDLGQLVEYTTAKNRLHNRFLFGDGVVCGLEVVCHPCGGGHVIVKPGYALDCCGEDIVVPCAHGLDINRMVRELLRARTGADCGPYPPKTTKDTVEPAHDNAALIEAGASKSPTARTYGLYVRYCEQPAEPVAPYTTDDPCAAQACEFSRVQEGYTFELRCAGEEPHRPALLEHLQTCLHPLLRKPDSHAVMRILNERSLTLAKAIAGAPEPGKATRPNLNLTPEVSNDLYEQVLHLERSASLIVRDDLARVGSAQGPRPEIETLRGNCLSDASRILLGTQTNNAVPEFENIVIRQIAAICQDLIDPAKRTPGWVNEYPPYLLAGGTVISARIYKVYSDAVEVMQPALLSAAVGDRVTCRPPAGVATMAPAPLLPPTKVEVAALSHSLTYVTGGLRQLVRDCVCLALLPKCAPCDDTAVLLACVTVDECNVVEICNMHRRFVLAPTTARYWAGPYLDRIGARIEGCCCGVKTPEHPESVAAKQNELQGMVSLLLESGFCGVDLHGPSVATAPNLAAPDPGAVIAAMLGLRTADLQQMLRANVMGEAMSAAPPRPARRTRRRG